MGKNFGRNHGAADPNQNQFENLLLHRQEGSYCDSTLKKMQPCYGAVIPADGYNLFESYVSLFGEKLCVFLKS
jgi:hypothetical protein